MMQLFYSPASPYARKVRVIFLEAGRSDAVEIIAVTPESPEAAQLIAANPLGKIPTLARPDGPALYDSRVICRYLDALYGLGLYPEHSLFETLTLEATGEGILDCALAMVYEHRARPPEKVHPPWVERQWDKIATALDALEQRWMAHLAGPLDAGQIAVGCALGYLDFRHAERDWRQGRPELARWFETFGARPSMVGTSPV